MYGIVSASNAALRLEEFTKLTFIYQELTKNIITREPICRMAVYPQ